MRSLIAVSVVLTAALSGCVAYPYYDGPREPYPAYPSYPAYSAYDADVYYYSYSPGPGYYYRPGYGYYRAPVYREAPRGPGRHDRDDRYDHGRNDDHGYRPPSRPDSYPGPRPDQPDRPNRPDRPSGGVGGVITGAVRGSQPDRAPRPQAQAPGRAPDRVDRPARDRDRSRDERPRQDNRPSPQPAAPAKPSGNDRDNAGRGGWGRVMTDR